MAPPPKRRCTGLSEWLHMLCAGVFAEEPTFISTNEGGRLLDVRFEHSNLMWPWSGFLALYIRVAPEGATFKVLPPAPISKQEKQNKRRHVEPWGMVNHTDALPS